MRAFWSCHFICCLPFSDLILLYASGTRQLWPTRGFDVRSPCSTDFFWPFATGRSRGELAFVFRYSRSHTLQRLYDRMWFFVTESLLAFTIFRDEFDIPLAVMFGFLLFVKSFHWLLADRIEWVHSIPANHSTVYLLSADEPNALSWSDHLVPHTNQWIIFHVMDYERRDVSLRRGKYSYQWSRSYHSICKRGQ